MEKTGAVSNSRRQTRPAERVSDAENQILTSREAREMLKIGRTKLHELTRRQEIPAYRIGSGRTSGLRYLRSDLLRWLYQQRV
jgi:excisionase family DNA binding protein